MSNDIPFFYVNIVSYPRPNFPDSKVHGADMGSIWGRQDPGGPHAGPMNFAILARLLLTDLC